MTREGEDVCPAVCPDQGGFKKVRFQEPGATRDEGDGGGGGGAGGDEGDTAAAGPYEPGLIEPPEPPAPPAPGAPPSFLPQPDTGSSGDRLTMSATGPWAPGITDWTPLAGMTGTRPVVDKYSITRYSLGEWRAHNQRALDPAVVDESNVAEYGARTAMMRTFGTSDRLQADNLRQLTRKAADLFRWQTEVRRAAEALAEEVVRLEEQRQRLKGAGRVLMLPEAISAECIELRTGRFEPDLVRDQAEQELVVEMSLVGEIRRVFTKTLADIEEQLSANKAALARVESDWSDKTVSHETETLNVSLDIRSNLILFKPGATRFGDNSSTLEYWEHFCRENIEQAEAVRQQSIDLRGSLDAILVKGGHDLRTQADRTDMALAETVASTEALVTELEAALRVVLQRIADVEQLIVELQAAVRKMDAVIKLAQTRLDNRNQGRPGVENCRDVPQYGLIREVKTTHENVTSLLGEVRNAENQRAALMKKRGDLEKEIAVKRKSLSIDRDRLGMVRSHYPSASELAGH